MTIQLRRSNTSGNVPSGLQDGQVAINQADDILFSRKPDGTIRRALLPKRYGVANAAFQIRAYDTYVGVTSLSASRVITLPAAANYPVGHLLTVADESGLVTASITVGLAVASGTSDTVNGASNLLFTTPYFGAILVSDGVSKWTALILGAGGSGSALLYTPQTLTAAQQLQTLLNVGLQRTNLWMTEIKAAATGYFGLLDGIADDFFNNSGIDTANAANATVLNGTIVNQASDPFAKALLHFNGANGATTTSDVTGKTVTLTGAAALSTTQNKFGGSSLATTASSGYCRIASGSTADFLLFGGDYTAEAWVYPTVADATARAIFAVQNSTNDRWLLYVNGGNIILVSGTAGSVITATAPALNGWSHIALVRSGTTTTLYVNGTSVGTTTSTAFPSTGTPDFIVGGDNLGNAVNFGGFIDEVRVSKGIARYTANFTPPSAEFNAGSSGVLTLPSINYTLPNGVPAKGSIRIRAKATADTIAPNTNFIASLSRNGTLGGSTSGSPNSLDVTLAQTATLPDGFAHYEANEVDLTGLASGAILKGALRTVGTTLGVAIDGWRVVAR